MGCPPSQRESIDSNAENLAHSDASEEIRRSIKKEMLLSKRRGSWFRLNLQERAIVDLSLSLNVKFRSLSLIRAVVSVLKKLRDAARPRSRDLMRGKRTALVFSEAAVSWGHEAARAWRWDLPYMAFLGKFLPS